MYKFISIAVTTTVVSYQINVGLLHPFALWLSFVGVYICALFDQTKTDQKIIDEQTSMALRLIYQLYAEKKKNNRGKCL